MNKKFLMTTTMLTLAGVLPVWGNQQPTSNTNPAYSQSNVQAQLRLNIREDADTVHFIRDTNDPKIITKTYVLKHADAYSIRPYLREMVQTLRVDYNNPAGLANTDYYNTYSKDNADKTKKIYVPTGIECIKFSDGTSIIMVSAEDYRFKDSPNGMGIDSLIETLDQKDIMNSSGQPKFIYFPANRPAKELQDMVKLVGANMSNDTVELIGGKDKVEFDEDLNCLFFNTALYSRKNIESMLKLYDVVLPEVRISCTVYEIDRENDGTLGMDFQSWKNNNGAKVLSTGGKWSKNYNLANMTNIVRPDGTINSNYFNVEPKWNTKFLDFLVSKGKAKVVTTGELAIQNGNKGVLERRSGVMYAALTEVKDEGSWVDVKAQNNAFKFNMAITPSITEGATTLDLTISTTSLLGYMSNGAIRTSNFDMTQKIMISNENNRFFLGGIDKTQVVSDVVGVPLLKDIPVLGWVFSTERESTKKSQLIVVADCEIISPNSLIDDNDASEIKRIKKTTDNTGEFNKFGYRQYLLDGDR